MNTTIIGLVGVIVGALLGGVITASIERRKRLVTAQAAGLLVVAELEDARRRVQGALADRASWTVPLPSDAWKSGAKDLAPAVAGQTLRELSATYRLLELANAQARDPQDMTLADVAERPGGLTALGQRLEEMSNKLEGELDRPPGRYGRAFALMATGVAIVIVLVAVFEPRPDFSQPAVAAALQSRLETTDPVECQRIDSASWRCAVTRTASATCGHSAVSYKAEQRSPARAAAWPMPRSEFATAEIRAVSSAPAESHLAQAEPQRTGETKAGGTCGKQKSFDVARDADGNLDATTHIGRGETEAITAYLDLKPKEQSLGKRLWRTILGAPQ